MKHLLWLMICIGVGLPAPAHAQQDDAGGGPNRGNVRLTKRPELTRQVEAQYTDRAVENGVEGAVKLRLTVSSTGQVAKVEVLDGLGYGLDEAAVAAAKQFEFSPAEINNQPAAVTLNFAVQFSLPMRPATLRGRLVDADSGQPLTGASVVIAYVGQDYDPAPSASTTTDADGAFSFGDVPPGPYQVRLETAGYDARQEQVELGSGETVEATYRFSKSPVSLRGTVREAGTRKPLAGIEVGLVDADSGEQLRTQFTDADAAFAFRGLSAATYQLVFEADGYEPYSSREVVKQDQVTTGTFYLRAEYYDEFTVKTTTRRKQREVSRKRISREELKRVPGTGGDVVRAVQNMPGVARPSYVGGNLIVRGAAPEDTQVFVQGDAIPLVFHFLGGPAVISSEMLDAVDFYPGNFSVYYGRATGGIVSLRTRSPRKDRFHGFAEVDLLDATAQFEGPVTDELSIAVSARRSYVDAVLPAVAPDDLTDQVTAAPRYYDYQGWVTWRPNDEHTIELFGYGSDDQIATVFDDDDEPVGSADFQITGASVSQYFHRGQLRWAWSPAGEPIENEFIASYGLNHAGFRLGEDLNLAINYYQSQIRDDLTIEAADNLELRLGADLSFGNTNYDIVLPRTDQDFGSGFNSPASGFDRADTNPLNQPAFYAEAAYKPIETLQFTPGVRLDYYGAIERTSISPRLTTRWELRDDLTVKGGVGLFTQPPIPNESDPAYGNDELTFEKAVHYMVGSEWRILDYLELDSTLYYRGLSDLVASTDAIETTAGGDASRVGYNNSGRGRAYGLEVMLRHYPRKRFFGWLSYTLSRAERYDPIEDEYSPFQYDQTHILTLVAGYNLPWGIDVSGRFRLVSGSPYTPVVGSVWDADQDSYQSISGAPYSARNDAFHQLDVRFDKKFVFDRFLLGVYLEVLNVYNAVNQEGRSYNYNYTETEPVRGLPIIPTLGVNGRF